MVQESHTCVICEDIFAHRSALKDRIKRVHQESVKVTFMDDTIVSVKRDCEGVFKCTCGRAFKLPGSLRRHAKTCNGGENMTVTTAGDDERELGMTEETNEQREEAEEAGEDTIADLSYDFVGIYSYSHMSIDRV